MNLKPMRHKITVAFLLAASVVYWAGFFLVLPGAVWFAGALCLAGLLCEVVFLLRLFRHEKP
jgi:hypothetical protein